MSLLILEVEEKEQRGKDTFLKLKLSEEGGGKSVVMDFTLHDTNQGDIDIDKTKTGMRIITKKERAPVHVNFGKPETCCF